MFEQATLSTAPASSRLLSTCLGLTGQALIVGCMLLAPLIWPQVLPQLQSYVTLAAPGPPPPPPPPPGNTTVRPRFMKTTQAVVCRFCAPVHVPDRIAIVTEDPPDVAVSGIPGGVPGGVPGGLSDGILTGVMRDAYAAPPPPRLAAPPVTAKVEAPAGPARLRVGGLVKLASPIRRVEPTYPPLAKTARIQGVVQLEGVIGTDGRIHELKVLSGHPLLIKAAVEAVQQWLYHPGTLNGELVEVIAPITVTFRLGN
jgi:protein TonB